MTQMRERELLDQLDRLFHAEAYEIRQCAYRHGSPEWRQAMYDIRRRYEEMAVPIHHEMVSLRTAA